ncbi:MAG TPA: Mut7-C RNAse domain-containing protein [Candidatus Binatia bacterium]
MAELHSPALEVRFAADIMLGRLAKWLRILGEDVIYGAHLTGYGLIRAARLERRLILTRDRSLKNKQPPPMLYLRSDQYREQLRQVIHDCGLVVGKRLFTRCLRCNTVLQSRTKDSVEKSVPPYVFSTQEKFFWCASCRRIYWPATHHQNMLDEIKSLEIG